MQGIWNAAGPKLGSSTLKQPSFNWEAPDKYTELKAFKAFSVISSGIVLKSNSLFSITINDMRIFKNYCQMVDHRFSTWTVFLVLP